MEFGAELHDFLRTDVARLYKKDAKLVQITLVEAQHILQSFDKRLQDYAARKITERSNFHLVQDSVVEVREDAVRLKSGDVIPCALTVWSTGLAPRDMIRQMDVPKNKAGRYLIISLSFAV